MVPQGSEKPLPELKNTVGLCFSSPPYFDCEIYNGEETSTSLHSSYADWVENYLKPTIQNCCEYLVEGGFFIVNIKNLGKHRMYDDADRICRECGLEFVCVEPYKVTHRTGAGNQKAKPRRNADEGMLVFRKVARRGGAPSPGSEGEASASPMPSREVELGPLITEAEA